ncbi:endolytic transglycosylase MltG [Mobilicoccus pelagius]|uniref:Endolytic murein transglycosylase n=1 Tax=Mobilicoccus pelagius NBRC 104925 TaxID=1089455 RepID=H5UV43_9MICO|nr:endolytic transglycosylase MltG [Mobilicoccus pelagius]GAB49601.1 hypothetical protein MOPEL_130_02080 [Mobilicoccus pelagius NBRC 104925]
MTDRHGDDPHDVPHEHPEDDVPVSRYDALLSGHGGEEDLESDAHVEDDEHEDDEHGHDQHGDDEHEDDLFDGHGATSVGRNRRGRGRRLAVLGVALALVLGGLVLAVQLFAPLVGGFFEKKDYDGPGTGRATVVVHQGDTGRAIGGTLQKADVVKTVEAFEKALAENPGDEIQPGTYALPTQMKAVDALSRLRSGEARDERSVTLREGLRASEIFAELSKATGVPVKEYVAASKKSAALGLPKAANGSVEGYLFPATYTFGPKATATEQLSELVGQATARYSALGVEEADMHEIITIASIVESEARMPEDRPKVAAVIENRLRIRMPLQLDSTVSYGVGKRTITTTDADRKNDNPYNTYLHPGLPKGPIDNPGTASVRAALHPAKGKWLYFVTINPQTGETAFAETHDQHNANVRKFQAWCQAHPGTC